MGIAPTAGATEAETHPENHCNSTRGWVGTKLSLKGPF